MIPADASDFEDFIEGASKPPSMDEWRSAALVIFGTLVGEIEFLLQNLEQQLKDDYTRAEAAGEQQVSTHLADRLAEVSERRRKIHTLVVELTRLTRVKPEG
jgi:hypothetical protein